MHPRTFPHRAARHLLFPLLSIFLMTAAPLVAADNSNFETTAKAALAALYEDDVGAFMKLCATPRVQIVRRGVDWDQTKSSEGPHYKSHIWDDDPLGIEHDKLHILVWNDEQVDLNLNDPDQRKELRKIIEKFRTEMNSGYGRTEISMTLTDEWGRNVGPAASGKICAGYFWFIDFIRQNGQWKVSKLELAVH
jgi:hypothetical protein